MSKQELPFYSSCVAWPRDKVCALNWIIREETQITRRTFLKHANRQNLRDLEFNLQYFRHGSQGLTMAGDWHVSYHKVGPSIYYFQHSGIEYVFAEEQTIKDLQVALEDKEEAADG